MNLVIKCSEKNIYLLVILICLVIRDFLRAILGEFYYTIEGVTYVTHTGISQLILVLLSICMLVVYFFKYGVMRSIPSYIKNSMMLIVILSFFWTVHTGFSNGIEKMITLDGTSKTVLICLVGVYIGFDEESWNFFKNKLLILTLLYMGGAVYYVLYMRSYGLWHEISNQSPYWLFYSTAFWMFSYLVLCEPYQNFKVKLYYFVLFFFNLLIVLFTTSRGWMLQSIVLTALFLIYNNNVSKKDKFYLSFILLMTSSVFFVVFGEEILGYIQAYFDKFQYSTSRMSQYEVFFSQVSYYTLLIGGGEFASYYYKNNMEYIYIDNSFLYYAFHFGALFALTMLYLFLKSSFKAIKFRKYSSEGNIGFVLIMWIGALMGASVFCAGYEVSFRLLFIMMLVGRTAYLNYHLK